MPKIMLIEDDEEIRELIKYNLQKNGHTVLALDNANDALIAIEDAHTDLILLDIMLPGLKGTHFLEILRSKKHNNNTPVIIISAKNAEHEIISAIEKGADDYLPKPFSMEMLNVKIKSILRRGIQSNDLASDTIKLGAITLDLVRYKTFVDGNEIQLTMKEFELLKIFISHPEKVFTRNWLLNTVWGYDSDSMTRTVDTHISNLRKKLGSVGEIIKSIPKIGYGIEL